MYKSSEVSEVNNNCFLTLLQLKKCQKQKKHKPKMKPNLKLSSLSLPPAPINVFVYQSVEQIAEKIKHLGSPDNTPPTPPLPLIRTVHAPNDNLTNLCRN